MEKANGVDIESNDRDRQSSLVFWKDPVRGETIQELAFLDLSYFVESTKLGKRGSKKSIKETLQVLKNVSGQANTSEMLALMGPSGSGKTSLLNVLAQRVPQKAVSGDIYVDGQPINKSFRRQMGFVFQDDLCLWNLTARETVTYAAKLRLPELMPESEKTARVTELLNLLGLTHVADNIIGKETKRGVSGGERKRVAIGVELITSPDILFLDEPTSGLDSSTALSIVTLLKRLAQKGMIVVCSIHQPRSNIFSKFDKVLLLDKGQTIYYGRRDTILPYFKHLGWELPPETNPADWILDMTAEGASTAGGEKLADAYARSRSEGEDHPVFNAVNVSQIVAVAVIASAVWWQSTNVSDISGVLFFISIQQAFNGLNTSMRVFPPERSLMMRERSTGSYRVGPYFLAKSLSDVGLYTVVPMLFATVVYWAVGLRPEPGAFFIFLVIFMGEVIVGQSLGLFMSAAIEDVFTAQSLSFVLILLLMLFGGFYVNNERIPEGISFLKYLSFLYYGYGGLIHNEFSGRTFTCYDIGGHKGASFPCAGGDEVPGEDILEEFGFDDVNVSVNIGALYSMVLGLRILTYLVIKHNTRNSGVR